jgi:hypothetical protein
MSHVRNLGAAQFSGQGCNTRIAPGAPARLAAADLMRVTSGLSSLGDAFPPVVRRPSSKSTAP